MEWQTLEKCNVQAVYFEDNGVTGHESKQVCPGSTETYRLKVTRGDGSTNERTITITVGGGGQPPGFSCGNVTETPRHECDALVAVYRSTNGVNWTRNDNWLKTNNPCEWRRVGCRDDHVIELDLYEHNLSGSIPPEIGNLSLHYFGFAETNLCEPSDAEFQAWLASIEVISSGIQCLSMIDY